MPVHNLHYVPHLPPPLSFILPLAPLQFSIKYAQSPRTPIHFTVQEGWIDSATFRDLPYDYATLLENLLDVGHVPFTHHASVSKRSSAAAIKLDMKTQGPTGFTGRNEQGPRKGQLG